jgi:hypothetical protein
MAAGETAAALSGESRTRVGASSAKQEIRVRSGHRKKQKCKCNKTKKKSQCPFHSLWVGFAGEVLMNKPRRSRASDC